MKRSILSLALLAAAASVGAETISVPHGLSGSWWHPELSGQGLLIEQMEAQGADESNHLGAYWFTYDGDGNPLYLTGAGEYRQGVAVVELVTTVGGRHGAEMVAEDVERLPWGTMKIVAESCESLLVSYDPIDGEPGEVALERFTTSIGMVPSNAICEMVEEELPVNLNKPATQIQVESCGDFTGCRAVSLPYSTNAQVQTSVIGSRPSTYTVARFRITPTDGYIDVKYVGMEDSNTSTAMYVTGISTNQRIAAGETVEVQLASAWTNGATEQLRFKIGLGYEGGYASTGSPLSIDYRVQLRTN